MEILLLVCAATIAQADCQVATATHVMRPTLVAAAGAPAGCLRDGLLYAAESGLVTAGHYAKGLLPSRRGGPGARRDPTGGGGVTVEPPRDASAKPWHARLIGPGPHGAPDGLR